MQLSLDNIRENIDTKWLGHCLSYYDITDSTNERINELARAGASHGTLAVADAQTFGRGRRGRSWATPNGVSIAVSFLLRPDIRAERAPMITLLAAMAVAEAIRIEDSSLVPQIKWPNDIVIGGKKVCGILTEMNMGSAGIEYINVGIGINVNTRDFEEDIKDIATSLYVENGGVELSRARLIGRVCHAFERIYDEFLETEDMSRLKDAYNHILVNIDKDVLILDPQGEYKAVSKGIDDLGQLVVIKEGTVEEIVVSSGEVSVRGIYGYV